jgi:predicted ATPase/DNA-binding CsgD family transcriptional regulator
MAGQTGPIVTDQLAIAPSIHVVADGEITSFQGFDAALEAAVEAHRQQPSPRVAVHRGDVRRAERLRDIGHNGQVLLSATAAAAAERGLPALFRLHDLGIHRLRDLSPPERVYELRFAEEPSESPPLRSLDVVPNNLPIYLTAFVGRDAELAAVSNLLALHRAVTITGIGGGGKTRLAAHLAAIDGRWRDGIWWVDLQSLADPAAVPEAVARTIGALVEPIGASNRSVAAQLRDRRVLLCLDNCEHLGDAPASLSETLIRTCPEVSVLATSREPLGVPGEAVWGLPTLTAAEALELFVERAAEVSPGFALDASNAAAVRRLCTGLDGIPLAIELAAVWLRTLTPGQIEAGLGDRFSLLVRSARGAAARHQTLAASIDWSHELLGDAERVVFRRLAAFAGGFSLDAARDVCADTAVAADVVVAALAGLVDKSLVVADVSGGVSRYRQLETIRDYAADRLEEAAESDPVRDRHLDHFLAVAEGAEPQLDEDKDSWRARLEPERDNLRTALDRGLAAAEPERGRRLAAAIPWLWNLRGRGPEGIAYLRRAIERAPAERSALQVRLLTAMAMIADTVAPDQNPAADGLEIASELGDERLRGRCLLLSAVATFYRDFDAGWRQCEEALRSAQLADDGYVIDGAHALQGLILHLRDDHEGARALFDAAARGLVARGDRGIAATVATFQSGSALYCGDVVTARRHAERAVQLAEPLGDYHRVGTARSQVALVHGFAGDLDAGLRVMGDLLRIVDGAGQGAFVPGMARVLGQLHLWRGDPEEALRWLAPGPPSPPPTVTFLDAMAMPALAAALRHTGRRDEAAQLLDRAVHLARATGMARVLADSIEQQAHLAADDDPNRAADLHHEALVLRVEKGLRALYVDSLDGLGLVLARTNRPHDAVRLLAAADSGRRALSYPRHPIDDPGYEATVTRLRTELGDDEFGERWEAGAETQLEDAVAWARRTRGSRGRPASGWASLTPTELDVVRLVADGLSNPDIGARLFISRGTVKTHLAHIFVKLDVTNRTELASLAASRRG